MGVWIETIFDLSVGIAEKSHPSWVCGLKHAGAGLSYPPSDVTPFVGVWIETMSLSVTGLMPVSHPSWVCGLKQ